MFDALSTQVSARLKWLRSVFADPADPASAARLQREQFVALRRNTPGMMAANIGNAFVLLVTFIDTPLGFDAALWTGAVLAVALQIFLRARRRIAGPRSVEGPTRIGRRAVVNALALGGLWAAVPLFFFLDASPGARLMVISLTAGMLFGGAFALARAPLAATVFAAPIAIASGVTLIRGHDPDLLRIAIVLCLYVAVLLRGVFAEAESFRERVLSQIDAEMAARTDPLTSLPNRLAFSDAIVRELARVKRYGGGFMLLCVDIDNFKTINDRYGHPAGDELLAEAARRMRVTLRTSDLVARIGGDEFAIIATDVNNDDAARILAGRIVACYDAPFLLDGHPVQGAASVGGALAPRDGDDERAIFKCADVALYQAKQQGGGWRLFERLDDQDAATGRQQERELRLALAEEQFFLAFQPILETATREIVGFEALLRWRHPTRGDIPPAAFIPTLESLGLIHDVGIWVIEGACRAAARFDERLRICVNVSAVQLRRPDFAERALAALTLARVSPQRLEIEITEKAMLDDDRAAEAEVTKLSRAGVCVSLDDFGSGYASLTHFCRLSLDRVKIDGTLARAVVTQKAAAVIVESVARMARGFHVGVVAEGVETIEQFEMLREMGIDEAQGFFIAAPMSLADLEDFVADWDPSRLTPIRRAAGLRA